MPGMFVRAHADARSHATPLQPWLRYSNLLIAHFLHAARVAQLLVAEYLRERALARRDLAAISAHFGGEFAEVWPPRHREDAGARVVLSARYGAADRAHVGPREDSRLLQYWGA